MDYKVIMHTHIQIFGVYNVFIEVQKRFNRRIAITMSKWDLNNARCQTEKIVSF